MSQLSLPFPSSKLDSYRKDMEELIGNSGMIGFNKDIMKFRIVGIYTNTDVRKMLVKMIKYLKERKVDIRDISVENKTIKINSDDGYNLLLKNQYS